MAEASFPAGLIDTDILIDALRGTEDGVAFLTNQHASSGVQISIISAMELVAGCRHSRELTFSDDSRITAISSILMQLGYNQRR